MEFDIYCDESRQDLFSTKQESNDGFIVLGGIWLKTQSRESFKNSIKEIQNRYDKHYEMKWNSVSNTKTDYYRAIIEFFFANEIRFRSIIIDSREIDLIKFHSGDSELAFYKFYYQLIHHWILDFNEYNVFLDIKSNHQLGRLGKLNEVLQNANLTTNVKKVQAVNSRESLFIQLADILIGAVGYKIHGFKTSRAKLAVIDEIEKELGCVIAPTPKSEEKFNVFKIRLKGGW